jgi:hypothetical protein
MATSCSGGRSRSTLREPPTMGKQLENFVTCICESSAPFCNLQSGARTHVVLVIGLYELLGIPTTLSPEPHGPSSLSQICRLSNTDSAKHSSRDTHTVKLIYNDFHLTYTNILCSQKEMRREACNQTI